MTRLLIIADHPLVVNAVRLALRQTGGFEVVGFLDGRHPDRAQLARLCPDVVVVDEMRSPQDALERVRETAQVCPAAKLVLLTGAMNDAWLEQAFDAGSHAAICKSVHPVTLGTLLGETARGNVVHRYARPHAAKTSCPLTARETEILALAAHGFTNGRIARELWIAEQTVKFHLSTTYRKLGVANRTEASRYAHMHDLVASPPAAPAAPPTALTPVPSRRRPRRALTGSQSSAAPRLRAAV